MKRFIAAFSLAFIAGVCAMAQTADIQKNEFYIGYSNGQVDNGPMPATQANTGIGDRSTFHGFEVAGVHNFGRYFGVKGDVSGTYNSTSFSFPVGAQTVSFDTKNSLYNVLGGVQIKDNAVDKKFKPFVHALAGIGHGRTDVSNLTCTSTPLINCGQVADQSQNGFAAVLGGGLDVRLSDNVDLRVVQLDYNPTVFDESTSTNYRIGFGIVFK